MGFIMDLLGGGALSGILGGLTGVLGTWLKSRHESKMAEIRSNERIADRAHDLAVLAKEGENAVAVAEIQRQEADDTAAGQALAESFKMEPKRYAEGMSFPANWYGHILQTVVSVLMFGLDFFRGVMRPGLTLYMAILVTWIYWELEALAVTYGVKLDVAKVMTAMTMIINTIVYLFVTCFVWWFGDRNRQAPPKIG